MFSLSIFFLVSFVLDVDIIVEKVFLLKLHMNCRLALTYFNQRNNNMFIYRLVADVPN